MAVVAAPELRAAALARLLSLGLSAPDEETLDQMAGLVDALVEEELPPRVAAALEDLAPALGGDLADAAAEHQRLFAGAVACPPYEGSYAPDPFQQSRWMSDVAGFYRAFGAAASGPAAERPDHAGCQCEFLCFLICTRLEAEAAGDRERAEVAAAAEQAFLRDHLGRWLGPFAHQLERESRSDLYRALGRLGAAFAVDELARRGLSADPVVARRVRTVVEGDTLECGTEPGACPLEEPHRGRRRRSR